MDLSSQIVNVSDAWINFSSGGVVGEVFRILKETADWLDALTKIEGLSSIEVEAPENAPESAGAEG